jgi:hypothetical protein
VRYHGSVTNAAGPARATWRYRLGDRTVGPIERAVDEQTFEQLYVGLGVLQAFRGSLCNEMGR